MTIPTTQRAVQLVGPDQLTLNPAKEVFEPGPRQILGRVEVTGLCFSDLKLLKQFHGHVRKSEIIEGLPHGLLAEIPGYVPGPKPTVPGHETVVRIVKVGPGVTSVKVGDRRLVQTDYRWLKTANSNAAFGYNFEGALQEYVLMDERAITSPDGESMLLPASEGLAASAIALVEPWACVEDSYVVRERRGLTPGGHLLIAGEHVELDWENLFRAMGRPATVSCLSTCPPTVAGVAIRHISSLELIGDETVNDIILFGADADLTEKLFPKLAKGGLLNLVLKGESFTRPVVSPVGRIHYGGLRITGTIGTDPAAGYRTIPETGEIMPGDRINVVGAAGPMGTMHVLRDLCQGVPGVSVYGGDMNEERLAALERLARPLAAANHLTFSTYHAQKNPPPGLFNYLAIMVPAPALVAAAVNQCASGAIINIFAGIPATVSHPLDLQTLVQQKAHFIGTSGSDLNDMKIVLRKVEARTLDTNMSVAAISGLEGAIDGIRAVEKQLIAGKILVYPSCRGLKLTPLAELDKTLPEVSAKLKDGVWTKEAEEELLKKFGVLE